MSHCVTACNMQRAMRALVTFRDAFSAAFCAPLLITEHFAFADLLTHWLNNATLIDVAMHARSARVFEGICTERMLRLFYVAIFIILLLPHTGKNSHCIILFYITISKSYFTLCCPILMCRIGRRQMYLSKTLTNVDEMCAQTMKRVCLFNLAFKRLLNTCEL